jgi:RimJ/RimL family protein N-acetyltransferase
MSESVTLAPWTDAHDARTVAWLNDPDIRATFGVTSTPTLEGHRRWKAAFAGLSAFAILAEGAHVGNALLLRNDRHRSAYLQLYIGSPEHRGRGLGRRSLEALLQLAFGGLGLHRVWLHTLPDNTAAERLYQSVGFLREGLERDAVMANGGFRSQNRWSLLASDFRSGKDAAKDPVRDAES